MFVSTVGWRGRWCSKYDSRRIIQRFEKGDPPFELENLRDIAWRARREAGKTTPEEGGERWRPRFNVVEPWRGVQKLEARRMQSSKGGGKTQSYAKLEGPHVRHLVRTVSVTLGRQR
eukprot:1130647-Rhodomonas_salina.3